MFDQIVFAGGGHRCWWQAGFWGRVNAEVPLAPRVIAGIASGAAMACMLYARDAARIMDAYRDAFDTARMSGEHRAERAYLACRRALITICDSQFGKFKQGAPEIRIGVARAPRWFGARGAALAGWMACGVDGRWYGVPRRAMERALGMHAEFVRAQDCASVEELADLLLRSLCVRPFTPVPWHNGQPVIDGGGLNDVPMAALDAAPGLVLVLVTRRLPRPRVFTDNYDGQQRWYVQPSRALPAARWDDVRPEPMRAAYALGARDAEDFLRYVT